MAPDPVIPAEPSDSAAAVAARRARTRAFERSRLLTGRRLVVRFSPEDAVRVAADLLAAQGFVEHEADLPGLLRAEGSEWVGRALWIGDGSADTFRAGALVEAAGLLLDGIEDWFPRRISPTLVVAAARALGGADTELFVVPIASRRAWWGDVNGAARRVHDAIDGVEHAARAASALGSVGRRIAAVADPDCPASRAKAAQLLGWK